MMLRSYASAKDAIERYGSLGYNKKITICKPRGGPLTEQLQKACLGSERTRRLMLG